MDVFSRDRTSMDAVFAKGSSSRGVVAEKRLVLVLLLTSSSYLLESR